MKNNRKTIILLSVLFVLIVVVLSTSIVLYQKQKKLKDLKEKNNFVKESVLDYNEKNNLKNILYFY